MKKIVDNLATVFIILIIFLIIIPLDTALLDVMLIVNISLSLIILITILYIKEPLEFSIFPSILLITTLFRIALTVSSTRLILGNGGNAGKIIKAFGEFVIGGNAVVGFIIFLIIVIVQFLVITKGAERVAEVAARFTLDAMPGKQMAIDADLNAGIINEDTARLRRKKIQREADFYGSMDGSTKFVKGDAIVSIIVVFINSIGGIIIGLVQGGQSIDEVLSIYIVATVGDGLVTQISALLISVATGLIVTRAASENNLSDDFRKQIIAYPAALMLAGAIMLMMCALPGFPVGALLVVGLLLIFAGFTLIKKRKQEESDISIPESNLPVSELEYYKDPENIYSLLNVEPIEIDFGYSLIPLIDEGQGGNFLNRVVVLRKQFASEMGFVIPSVHLRDSSDLNPNQYTIKIRGEEITKGEILADRFLVMGVSETDTKITGIDTLEPAFNIPAKWISADIKEKALLKGYTVIDPLSVIITHLSEIIKKHSCELFGRKELVLIIDNLKKSNKDLIDDIIPAAITMTDLQKILENLLSEYIPIKDMETILETIGKYSVSIKDTDMLTEYVRQALKRTITHKFVKDETLKVLTINPDLESIILNNIKKTTTGSYVAVEPDMMQKIITAHVSEINKIKDIVNEVVILTSPVVRYYYKRLTDQFADDTIVLSFNEIEANVNVQAIGIITV